MINQLNQLSIQRVISQFLISSESPCLRGKILSSEWDATDLVYSLLLSVAIVVSIGFANVLS
jgi:hypothetical protein